MKNENSITIHRTSIRIHILNFNPILEFQLMKTIKEIFE